LHFLFLFVIFAITAAATTTISMYLSEIFFFTLVSEQQQTHRLGLRSQEASSTS